MFSKDFSRHPVTCIILWFILRITDGEINVTISEEKRLVRFLMRRYKLAGRGGRPVLNFTEPVKVAFGLGLIQMELNEKYKMLVTSMWSTIVSYPLQHSR